MYRMPRRGFLELILLTGAFGVQWLNPLRALSALFSRKEGPMMLLPKPAHEGSLFVEEAIKRRRTVRSFSSRPMKKQDLSKLLYAAQGITEDHGFKRAAPSGGALYPLDVYTVVGDKGEHVTKGDRKEELAKASLHQMWMAKPPLNFVITAQYSRICSKYGDRGVRYAMIEAGHVGQNIFLQAEALGLKAGIVGAFEDMKVINVLGIPKKHEPLLIMPVGYRA
ncbi:MAG: SagB/ThcOx family dehydrogenase [Deltaproteobacteria bacterium]|nr:SagB/ThcOx family dehydrogenase [Deltaproteobacteria bacterium]